MGPQTKKPAKAKVPKVTIIPQKYVDAVNNGVAWLDLTFGRKEWLRRMDMSNFHIVGTTTCVAGNVFKDVFFQSESYSGSGYSKFIDIIEDLSSDGESTATRLGFVAGSDKGMQHLQDLWVDKITKLKKSPKRKKA